jgi:hypothetical protein
VFWRLSLFPLLDIDVSGHTLYLYPQNMLSTVPTQDAEVTLGRIRRSVVSCPSTDNWGVSAL